MPVKSGIEIALSLSIAAEEEIRARRMGRNPDP